MIIPTGVDPPPRRRIDRAKPGEPDLATLVAGIAAFLAIAAACLYLVAHAAR